MRDLIKEIKNSWPFQLVCVALVFALLTGYKCVENDFCDSDPLYGGCSSSCEYSISAGSVFGKTMGFSLVLVFGLMIGEGQLKRKLEKEINETFSDYENSFYYKEKVNKKDILSSIKSSILHIINKNRDYK